MKHIFRDFLIKLFFVTGVTYIYRRFADRQKPLVRVVSFHDVDNRDWFDTLIDNLNRKYQIISPEDFISGNFVKDKIN